MKLSKINFQIVKRYLSIIVGSFILGMGTGLFLIPYSVVSGGVSGIGIIIHGIFGFDTEIVVLILTWIFFFLGWILLGTKFATKTLLSSILYPLATMLGTYLHENTIFNLGEMTTGFETNVFLAALIGGAFVGIGVGLTFIGGGSTGGVDIISLSFKKYFGLKTSRVSFCVDATIIVIGFIFSRNFYVTIIGIISALIASLMIGRLFDNDRNVIVDIISKKYEEINRFVIEKLDRGSTIIAGVGGYSKEDVILLRVALDIREYYILMDIIAQVDPKAFVTVSNASTIRGEGFKAHQVQSYVGKKNNDQEQ